MRDKQHTVLRRVALLIVAVLQVSSVFNKLFPHAAFIFKHATNVIWKLSYSKRSKVDLWLLSRNCLSRAWSYMFSYLSQLICCSKQHVFCSAIGQIWYLNYQMHAWHSLCTHMLEWHHFFHHQLCWCCFMNSSGKCIKLKVIALIFIS